MTAPLLLITLLCGAGATARAQEGMTAIGDEDYLTSGEISAVRDAQQPDKRMILYMDFAQRRIDSVKQALRSGQSSSGRTAQKALIEYVRLMEALESTMGDARERRAPMEKGLKDVETRGREFLKYLESLNSESSPGWEDYQYTVEEAIDMTKDELAEVAKGAFPEVQGRTPPRELPGLPSSRPPAKSDAPSEQKPAQQEEGPPRKSRPSP